MKPRLKTLPPRLKAAPLRANALEQPERYGQGRGGRPWRRKVERIKVRDKYTCYVCGRVTTEGDVDHKVPLSQGGTDDDNNLGWICRKPCHETKTRAETGRSRG